MAQLIVTVSGSRDEPFYELLHPDIAVVPSPSGPSGDYAQNGLSKGDDPASNPVSSADRTTPKFEPQPTHGGFPSKDPDVAPVVDKALVGNQGRHSPASSSVEAKVYLSSDPPQTRELLKSKQEDRELFSSVTVAAVERTMKKYADDILCVLEGINSRLSQLETTALRLDYSIEGLKEVEGDNHGDIDNRLRKLENLFREVQVGVQVLHDKQEMVDARSQYLKLQLPQNTYVASSRGASTAPVPEGLEQPKPEVPKHLILPSPPPPPPPTLPSLHSLPSLAVPSVPHTEAQPTQASVPPHSQQPFPVAVASIVQNERPIQQQTLPLSPQHPGASSQPQQTTHTRQPFSFYSQHSQHQRIPQGSYSQQPETTPYNYVPPSQHFAGPAPSSSSYAPEVSQYVPGSYGGPTPQLPPEQILCTAPLQLQNFVGQQYEPQMARTVSSFPHVDAFAAASTDEQQSSGYGGSPYRLTQPVPSAPNGGSYTQPAAQPLKHALPASGVDSFSTNRIPIDEVIEKVAHMGFSRDQVRTVVRGLTDTGQAVDLNVVLDKLMNGWAQP